MEVRKSDSGVTARRDVPRAPWWLPQHLENLWRAHMNAIEQRFATLEKERRELSEAIEAERRRIAIFEAETAAASERRATESLMLAVVSGENRRLRERLARCIPLDDEVASDDDVLTAEFRQESEAEIPNVE